MNNEKQPGLGGYNLQFGLNEYFQDSLLSLDMEEYIRVIEKTTPRLRSEAMLLILVRSGKGQIQINNFRLSLEPGSFLCLGPFHNYSISPEEEPMSLSFCKLDCSVYNYIMSCPYVKVNELIIPQKPVAAKLNRGDWENAMELMDRIHHCSGGVYYDDKLRFMLVMELIGLMMQNSSM